MLQPINIYIDHVWTVEHKEGLFAKSLKDRLKTIKKPFYVRTFDEINDKSDDWETPTLENIRAADIVIPIISSEYLAFVSEEQEKTFNEIIDSGNRYLFPILFKASNWENYNWIVRTNLIPDDNIPISKKSDEEIDRILYQLVNTIETIISKSQDEAIINLHEKVSETINSKNVVFISHDHDDADFAELLKLQLEKNGIIGWIDSERLKIGQDWRQEIDDGINNSLAVIAIMTPEARKSEYVTYEWAYAWGRGKKIFPIMLKQTSLHPRLESLQYLDFTKRESRPYDKLISSIKELL